MRDLLFRSRIFNYLAAATPGLKELVTIGKIWELTLDQRKARGGAPLRPGRSSTRPATGHGVGFLQTPRTFANIARVGPIRQQAETLDAFIRNRERTGVAVVALPEEMPVNETAALERDARRRGRGRRSTGSSATASTRSASPTTRSSGSRRSRRGRDGPAARAACRAALTESRRARDQREQLARLEETDEAPVSTLPFLFEPELGVEQIGAPRRAGGRLMAGVADLLEGKRDLRLRRLGRRRQDDHLGGDRRRDGGARQAGRGADDRPGEAARRLARAARARQRRAPGRPGAVRGGRRRHRRRRALGDDARREADLRRGRPRARPRRRDPRADPLQPHLPAALVGARRLAGVHGDGEALRDPRRGPLRPARPRHAAVAQRARLPRRARTACCSSSRAARCRCS